MLNILNYAEVVRIGLLQLLVSGIEKCKRLQKSLLEGTAMEIKRDYYLNKMINRKHNRRYTEHWKTDTATRL